MQTTASTVTSSEIDAQTSIGRASRPTVWACLGGAMLVFLGTRLITWSSTVRFEDHDSIGYLTAARAFRTLDPVAIGALSPDYIPLYSMVTAMLSLITGDLATGARLASLLGGALLLICAVLIARRIGGMQAALLCAFLIALNPLLIWLSIAVLAESFYLGVVYAGLWLFWSRRERPGVGTGIALGAIFGAAFITRFEGLLYLGLVPLWQGTHYLLVKRRAYDVRLLARWALAFGLTFVMLAAPQVWDVSRKMGGLALNGRQAWSVLMADRSRDPQAAIYGLDLSPSRVNLHVVMRDPTVRRQLGSGLDPLSYVRMAYTNWDTIYRQHLGAIAGPLLLMLFGAGLVALVHRGQTHDALIAITLIAAGIAAPLIQPYLLLRHMAVLVPILCIVAAVGAAHVGGTIARTVGGRVSPQLLASFLAATAILLMIAPLREVLTHPPNGYVYDPAAMTRAVEAVRTAAARDGVSPPVLSSRRNYVPYHAEARWVISPWADYPEMVRYLRSNSVQYLLVEHGLAKSAPFFAAFAGKDVPPDFELLNRDMDVEGHRIELFRLRSAESVGAAAEAGP